MADVFDLIIDQGATYTLSITYTDSNNLPINLTGYTAAMQIRKTHNAAMAEISLTSSSGITLGGAAGTIVVLISATDTATLGSGYRGVYDLELTTGTTVTRLLEGEVTVKAQVTR